MESRWSSLLTIIRFSLTWTPHGRTCGPSKSLVPWRLSAIAFRRSHDVWAHQFPDRNPDGAQTVSRRIDRIFVSHSLLGYASSMFTTPVGFSDHNSVVLQFVGLGLDGEQPARWKFPLDALQDSETIDWVSQELQALEDEGVRSLEAFQRIQVVLQEVARHYNASALVATPAYLRLRDILCRSSPEYVPLAGFAALREEGQRPETMRDAYIALVKAVSVHRGVEQLERTYTRVRGHYRISTTSRRCAAGVPEHCID